MIQIGDNLDDGGTSQFDVAIVGAGAMGIAVATRIEGRAGRVALIEAGGRRFNYREAQDYLRAEEVGTHYPTELYRRRMLGGTTSVWGGRCIPLDPEDLLANPSRSGWPISFTDLSTYFPDANRFLDAGEADFFASGALPSRSILLNATSDLDIDRIERFSKPTDVWIKYKEQLSRSSAISVISGAACVEILVDDDGRCVTGLKLKTPSNRNHTILAPIVVLACGGLETPRLLLVSRHRRSCGIGNEHDVVGRYYMSHVGGNIGKLQFAKPEMASAFDYGMTVDGIYGRRLIQLCSKLRQRDNICNIVFRPSIPTITDPTHGDPVLSAMFLVKRLIVSEYARRFGDDHATLSLWMRHVMNVGSGTPQMLAFGIDWMFRRVLASRKLPSVFLYRSDGTYPLESNIEQLPNADSRVLLGSQTDPFGVPRLIVRWCTREDEVNTIGRAYRALRDAVLASGLGTVILEPNMEDLIRASLASPQGGHHIGTARMGENSNSSVVDTNCEVWSTHGLFLAGSAVFPTSGFANPTLSAVALSLRLADYIVGRRTREGNG